MTEITDIAPSADTKEEAESTKHKWRFLVYGNPGVGKTHFACSMPGPIAFIDTEGKGNAIFDKFDKEIVYWKATDYDELSKSLAEALDTLNAVKAGEIDGFQKGTIGTIVIDSMALCWEWAQQKYVQMAYPGKSVDDVEFQSALQGGGQSDWKAIKRLHNDEFRKPMLNSDFHFCWTATSSEDYGAVLSGEADDPPEKPNGEKNNVYKCSELVHIFEGDQGRPKANLRKSSLTRIKFGRMLWPDSSKVRDAIQTLHDAEMSDEKVHLDDLENELDVDLFTGDPDIIYRNGGS